MTQTAHRTRRRTYWCHKCAPEGSERRPETRPAVCIVCGDVAPWPHTPAADASALIGEQTGHAQDNPNFPDTPGSTLENPATTVVAVSTELASDARRNLRELAKTVYRATDGPQEPVTHLEAIRHATWLLDRARDEMVAAARAEGVSWNQIGSALGVTKQAARQRWTVTADPADDPRQERLDLGLEPASRPQ